MAPEILGHLGERAEEAREDARVGREHRLLLVHGVEGDRAVVGVDDDLHGVPDVVEAEPAQRLRVGDRSRAVVYASWIQKSRPPDTTR